MNTWIDLFQLVKEDYWVSGVVSAIVAFAFSGTAVTSRWIYRRIRTLVSLHYREAEQFNGDWYLFHWNLINDTGSKIRMSRLRFHRRLNGAIEVKQSHPQTLNAVYIGTLQFDNQNLFIVMNCLNDSDSKLITFHRILSAESLGSRYAVGVMSGLTHERNPYACKVVLAEHCLSPEIVEELLGPRRVVLAKAIDRDRLSKANEGIQLPLNEAQSNSHEYTSPLLDV